MFGLCLLCQGSDHQRPGCTRVDFRRGDCCMTCGFPQRLFGERIHGNAETGECEDGLKDLMKGACWKVYRDEKLREQYLKEVESEIKNEMDYKKWIVGLDTSGEMVNGCRLVLNIWRDMK